MNKRAVYFTFIAMLFVILFYLIIQAYHLEQNRDERYFEERRFERGNAIILDVETQILPMIISTSVRNTLDEMARYLNESQSFFSNHSEFIGEFNNALDTATINGSLRPHLQETSYRTLLERYLNLTNTTLHMELMIDPAARIELSHLSPFTITATTNVTYGLRIPDAIWRPKTVTLNVSIPINDLLDPIYVVNTKGKFLARIRPSDIKEYKWNASLLEDAIDDHTYHVNDKAPDFLSRYTKNRNASAFGIESFVDPDALNFIVAFNRSYVDYLFWDIPWNCTNYTTPTPPAGDLFAIDTISALGFRIDDAHKDFYLTNDERKDTDSGGLVSTVCSN